MSIEAFLWQYDNGEPIGFEYQKIIEIFASDPTEWLGEYGCLKVQFSDPKDFVDIYLGEAAAETGHVRGITISRPLRHPDYLERIFQILELGNVMMFYSDDTTPLFREGADITHYPNDILSTLGEPGFVSEVDELIGD